ncbi:MAG TPA: SLC13 family permease [Spongiibacteraceae bacterium]|nr:SLC13 family permease [Spongiibacteraceae bacterium]
MFSPEALITLSLVGFSLGLLMMTRLPADAVLVGAVSLLLLLGILTPSEALGGMANEGMITVGVLFVVAQGLNQTGAVAWISQSVLGRPRNTATAQFRLMAPVALMSSVLNNTPVVAMLVPAVSDWAKRHNLSASQLMIPLSYAAIIGGTCTLVGTSTNLVVNGMLANVTGLRSLEMFELAWIGLPCTVLVIAFTIAFSRWLLPNRSKVSLRFEDARQYVVEMEIDSGSPLDNRSIEDAGLRHLPGMYLMEIERKGRTISAVGPEEILLSGDRLIFVGDVRSVVDLKNIRGLRLADDQAFKLGDRASNRCLVEVVVSPNFPWLGRTVRDTRFRNRYGAVIIAIARDGKQLKARIGDVVLRPGDTLLLETHDEFVERQSYAKDFLLVSRIENSEPVRHEQRWLSVLILLAMVVSVALGWISMFKGSLLAAGLMLITRCLRVDEARRCVDWQILLVIAASIGLGTAIEKTGAASAIASQMIVFAQGSPATALAILFGLTVGFSAVISNVAAAVLLFPVALASAQSLNVSVLPFAVTLMIAASTCFATPIGYQTNLMVYGPGDYRFTDFLRIGLPLTAVVGVATFLIVPVVWPF